MQCGSSGAVTTRSSLVPGRPFPLVRISRSYCRSPGVGCGIQVSGRNTHTADSQSPSLCLFDVTGRPPKSRVRKVEFVGEGLLVPGGDISFAGGLCLIRAPGYNIYQTRFSTPF